jgi:hypothetical protein
MYPDSVKTGFIDVPLPTTKSLAIPLPPTHIHRTDSELELDENMAMAEYRDIRMFNRIVSGMQQRQQMLYDSQNHDISANNWGEQKLSVEDSEESSTQEPRPPLIQDTQKSLENIVSTRCSSTSSLDHTDHTMSQNYSSFVNMWSEASYTEQNQLNQSEDCGWAIEGFHVPQEEHHVMMEEDNEEYHIFHIEI